MRDTTFMDIVLSPFLWLALLGVWCIFSMGALGKHVIYPKFVPHKTPPGTLVFGGSEKTSGTEKRVLATVKAAGFSVLPSSVMLVVPLRNASGDWRKFTPDIVLAKKKIIVEVDPYAWHGQQGANATYADLERNQGYSACGWAVVRVRIGWPKNHPWIKLGKYDLIIPESEFVPSVHGDLLRRAINSAAPVNSRTWDRHLQQLKPYADAAVTATKFRRAQGYID